MAIEAFSGVQEDEKRYNELRSQEKKPRAYFGQSLFFGSCCIAAALILKVTGVALVILLGFAAVYFGIALKEKITSIRNNQGRPRSTYYL